MLFLVIGCNKPFTLLAEVHCNLLGDPLRDVHLSTQAGYAHVGWVGRNRHTTSTAQAGEKRIRNIKKQCNWQEYKSFRLIYFDKQTH